MIDCYIILHNLLVNVGEDNIPKEWESEEDAAFEIGASLCEFEFARAIDNTESSDEWIRIIMNCFQGIGLIDSNWKMILDAQTILQKLVQQWMTNVTT